MNTILKLGVTGATVAVRASIEGECVRHLAKVLLSDMARQIWRHCQARHGIVQI